MESRPQTDQEFMADFKKWREESERFAERISISLENCQKVRDETNKTIQSIDNFKTTFSNAMNLLAEKFAANSQFQQPFSKYENPEEVQSNSTIEKVAELLQKSKYPVFLTGAGISVASGMPTFRGSGGIWTKNNENYDPKEVCTKRFFDEKSDLYWQWNNEFLQKIRDCKPNINHQKIAELHENKVDSKMLLVTQNIDGYHVAAKESLQKLKKQNLGDYTYKKAFNYGFCDDIYEIHGNMNYFRCQNECEPRLFDPPADLRNFQVPTCPQCKNPARPHENYRVNTIKDYLEDCDLFFVIGTMLETGFANSMVRRMCEKNVNIVEINPLPIINYQKNNILKGNSENIIPGLIDTFFKMVNKQENNHQIKQVQTKSATNQTKNNQQSKNTQKPKEIKNIQQQKSQPQTQPSQTKNPTKKTNNVKQTQLKKK